MTELQETIYEHATGSKTFTITASETWSISMVKKLKADYPDEVEIKHTNRDGSMLVHIPFEWMRILPKKKVALTSEERKIRADRMREAQKGRHHRGSIIEIEPKIDEIA